MESWIRQQVRAMPEFVPRLGGVKLITLFDNGAMQIKRPAIFGLDWFGDLNGALVFVES